MSRLVDADALIEVIKESRPLNWTDSESELQEDADYNHFIEMVNAQPTAYDIEKVVAELESQKEKCYKEFEKATDTLDIMCYGNMSNAYGNAIKIVRKGGVE